MAAFELERLVFAAIRGGTTENTVMSYITVLPFSSLLDPVELNSVDLC